MSEKTLGTRAAWIAVLAPLVLGACRGLPVYDVDIPYGQRGYFVLHVKDTPQGIRELSGDEGQTEEIYGLRLSEKYVSASGYDWMAFWGDQPPDRHAGSHRVLKNPWLLRVRGGRWQVAGAEHQRVSSAGEPRDLQEIRPGPDGEPQLVYATAAGRASVETVAGWRTVRNVRFQPPADAESR